MTQARLIGVLCLAGLVAACGGGGGDAAPTPSPTPTPTPVANNLSARALLVTSSNPTIGKAAKVLVTIAAVRATDDVSVGFYAIGAAAGTTGQFPLGTQRIARVEAGTRSYELDISVPASIPAGGAYVFGAIVDPASLIEDNDRTDNVVEVQATLALPQNPNLFIAQTDPDSASIVLDTGKAANLNAGDVYNSDAGANIVFGVDGSKTPVTVSASADLRLTVANGQQKSMALYLWNSELERYVDAYGISSGQKEWLPFGAITPQAIDIGGGTNPSFDVGSNPVSLKTAHVDFYFPGGLAAELDRYLKLKNRPLGDATTAPPDLTPAEINALRDFLFGDPALLRADICVKVRFDDQRLVDSAPADNERCYPVVLVTQPDPVVPPEPTPPVVPPFANVVNPLLYQAGYATRFGSEFAIGLRFAASMTGDNRGLIYGATAALPLTVFGQSVDLLAVTGRAQLAPLYTGGPVGQSDGYTLQVLALGQVVANLTKTSNSFNGCACIAKEKTNRKTVYVGPVPVTAEGTVQGTIGADYGLDWIPNAFFDLNVAPKATLAVQVNAAVGVPGMRAGAYGSLAPFLADRFTANAQGVVRVVDSGAASPFAAVVTMRPSLRIVNDLQGPVGEIGLFGEYGYPTISSCGTGLGFSVPCPGWATARENLPLERWRSFRKVDTLLNAFRDIGFISQGGAVTYYGP